MKTPHTISLTILLLIAPALCGSMLWVCISEAKTLATEDTERTERKIEIYCHNCDSAEIAKLLPKEWQIEKGARLKLQWALDTEAKGRLTLLELSGPCEPVRVIWQSKKANLRSAVREFIARGK